MWNKISGDESNSSPLVNTSGGSFSSQFRAFFWNQAGECLISCPRIYTCSHRFNSRQQMHLETWTGVLVAIALSIAAANCEHRANRVGNPPETDDYYCFFTESVSNCWKCPYSGPAILWNFLFNLYHFTSPTWNCGWSIALTLCPTPITLWNGLTFPSKLYHLTF